MVVIPGYEIVEKLYESKRSLVYRGLRSAETTSVVLKVMQAEYPSLEEIRRYRLEYEIINRLNLKDVVKAHALESYQNGLVLVLEDFGGESLRQLMQHRSFDLAEVLELAIATTQILGQVHAASIIHKDINPANLALNSITGQLKLIDFGNATVLSRENPTFRNPNMLEGTLPYLSPEQTGRMNRALDYRTDFYSLGITLYELLTGVLPFTASDPLELIHCHLAKQPEPPHVINPQIPTAVSEIVLKLLAKNAEDRYQSAYGLQFDLQHCLNQLRSNLTRPLDRRIVPFSLAQHDASGQFQLSQKLYGREQEVALLLAGFERVTGQTEQSNVSRVAQRTSRFSDSGWNLRFLSARAELMLIAGYSGIGKSALVQEIYKPVTRRSGYFISGKFDQFQRNVPYSALIQAFKELIRQLLTESPEQVEHWRSRLLSALGNNGQVVVDVIPEIGLITGQQPPVPELPPREQQNRFNLVFQKFVNVFAQAEHPLVIFLDDLQWSDAASLKLLQLLMTAHDSRYLLLIGAYRSNEVSTAHPLMVTGEEIRRARVPVTTIELRPLDQIIVQQIITDTFSCNVAQAEPLSALVMQITDGNPFFVNEFLKSLYSEGLLNFDVTSGQWQWSLDQIRAASIPDNVVDLMADKIQKSSSVTRQALKLAACVGNLFDAKTLAVVSGKSVGAIAADLLPGVQAGLIVPLEDHYKFAALEQQANDLSVSFKFLHDRVQQAAYTSIPENERQQMHYTIGQVLLKQMLPEQRDEKIFDIVNQLNMGVSLVTEPEQRLELARLNLTAGTKAKDSTAYEAATRYLLTAIGLLEIDSWQTQYDLTLQLYDEAAETAYLSGDFDEAERLVEQVLHQARTTLDRVNAYQVRIAAYSAQNSMQASLDSFVAALELMGEKIPRHPNRLQVGLELLRTRYWFIGNRSTQELEALPAMTDPYKLAVIQLARSVIMASVNTAPLFTAVLALRIINMIVRYGTSPLSAVQGIAYGVMLRIGLGDIDRAYDFGQFSLRLLDRFNARFYRTFTILGFESCLHHWKEPLRGSLPTLLSAYSEGLEMGNLEPAGLAASVYCFHRFFLGDPLDEVATDYEEYISMLVGFRQEATVYSMQPWQQLVLHLRGQAIDPQYLTGDAFNESEMLPMFETNKLGLPIFYTCIAKGIWLYHAGDYGRSLKALKRSDRHQESSPVTVPYANRILYKSLAYLGLCTTASLASRRSYLRQVDRNQRLVKRWARFCPANYQPYYDLVEAERLRVRGRYTEAVDYYERAIQVAATQDYLNLIALANELAGKMFIHWDQDKLALPYLLSARHAYLRWGAMFKVQQLDAAYPQLGDRVTDHSTNDLSVMQGADSFSQPVSSNSESLNQSFNLDLNTVIKAAQAISGEIVLDHLLEKLLRLSLENAGAQKGCLLLSHSGELYIEAESILDSDEAVVIQSRPLTPDQGLPLSVINYVQRTREGLVLADAAQEERFATDPYITTTQPHSILCSPILGQGNLIGILYLENNLATAAFTPARLTVLNLLSAQAAIALENAQFYRTLEEKVEERTAQLAQANHEISLLNQRLQSENLRLGAELAITRQIQQMILPKEHELDQIPHLEIAKFMEPAEEVGGDYFDVLYQNDAVKIGIGDITGHGLESGVLMLMVQTAVRTLLATEEDDPTRFLSILNRVIYNNVQRMNSDRNLSLSLIDYEAGRLRLSGQHEEVLVIRVGGIIERIDTDTLGFPIGLVDDISRFVTQQEIQLAPGEGIVLYTDGVTEALNLAGELYGLQRLCNVLQQNWQRSANQIQQAIVEDLRQHIGTQKVFDDITLLVIKQKSS